jgi:hypothetical protein
VRLMFKSVQTIFKVCLQFQLFSGILFTKQHNSDNFPLNFSTKIIRENIGERDFQEFSNK